MFQLITALAVAISTMLGAVGSTLEVTSADVLNGEAATRLRLGLAVAAQNQPEETPVAEVMARLQNQVRSMVRQAQEEGLDEEAMEAIMAQVRQRLQLQLEQCEDGACQFGLGEALRATEQWRRGFQAQGALGDGGESGGPPAELEPGPPADAGGPGLVGGSDAASGPRAGRAGGGR